MLDSEHEEHMIRRDDLYKEFDKVVRPLEELGNKMICELKIKISDKTIKYLKHLRFETHYYTSSEGRLSDGRVMANKIKESLNYHNKLYEIDMHDSFGKVTGKPFNRDNDWGTDNKDPGEGHGIAGS